MNKKSTSKTSKTDWTRLRALSDSEIHFSAEHPEADPAHIVKGIVRQGLPLVARKEAISLRVDADVIAWFRAAGIGWQTRMNSVLRAYKEAAAPQPVRKSAKSRRAVL